MEKMQEKNRLIFIINLTRLILVVGCAVVLYIIQKAQPDYIAGASKLSFLFGLTTAYTLIVLFAPFDKFKNKFLGYLFCFIDSLLILGLIKLSGEISSPFFILFFFPLISLSFLYEIVGSFFAAALFTLYTIIFITMKDYNSKQIADIFISMGILVIFSLYLGNIGKNVKGRKKIKELENEIAELKARLK